MVRVIICCCIIINRIRIRRPSDTMGRPIISMNEWTTEQQNHQMFRPFVRMYVHTTTCQSYRNDGNSACKR